MINNIFYGTEDNISYFVQTACNEEHLGEECDCVNYGSFLSEKKARIMSEKLAEEFNVPVYKI